MNREAPAAGAMPKFPPTQQILNRSPLGTSLTFIFTKLAKQSNQHAKRMINFFKKKECLSRKPKLSKADLSPNKGQKRKKPETQSNPINPSKQTKLTQFMTI